MRVQHVTNKIFRNPAAAADHPGSSRHDVTACWWRLQIDHSTPGDHKAVTVTGPTPESVASAVAQINELMRVDASPGMGEVTEAVPCPPGIVGRIIGRGGETIRGLQQASQAHIVVNQVRHADELAGSTLHASSAVHDAAAQQPLQCGCCTTLCSGSGVSWLPDASGRSRASALRI